MKAFFVHDKNKQADILVVPERDCLIPVNRAVMEMFIAVAPDFTRHKGHGLNSLPPESFGHIIATRESDGDVCIVDGYIWQQRMGYHLAQTSGSGL